MTHKMVPVELLTKIREQLGWRGEGEHDDKRYYCEFCSVDHKDFRCLEHRDWCPVSVIDKILAAPPADARNEALEGDIDEYLINALQTCREYVIKYGIAYGKEPEILLMAIGAVRELKQLRALNTPAVQQHDTETEQRWPNAETPAPTEPAATQEAEPVCPPMRADIPAPAAAHIPSDAEAIEAEQLSEAAATDSRVTLTQEQIENFRDGVLKQDAWFETERELGEGVCNQALTAIDLQAEAERLKAHINDLNEACDSVRAAYEKAEKRAESALKPVSEAEIRSYAIKLSNESIYSRCHELLREFLALAGVKVVP